MASKTFFASRFFGPQTGGSSPSPPAAPVLASADNLDGTGLTVTVAGSTAGSTNTILAQQVAPTPATGFTAVGSRTGDGTVSLALGVGYWWLQCQSTVAGVSAYSNVVYGVGSDNTRAVWDRCIDAVVATLKTLTFIPLPGGNPPAVIRQKTPTTVQMGLPAIVCTFEDVTPTAEPVGFEQNDELGYPVVVRIFDRSDAAYQATATPYLRWRQQMERALRFQALAGVPEIWTVRIEESPAMSKSDPAYQLYREGFTLRCMSVEAR